MSKTEEPASKVAKDQELVNELTEKSSQHDPSTDHDEKYIEPFTEEEERRVLRKIDIYILPFMAACFLLQYLDKQLMSYGAIFGLREDLKFSGQDYSVATSMFFIGQLVAEFPLVYALHRFPVARFIGISVILWGGVLMTAAATQNFGGFAAQRFFLGAVEGAVSPGFVLVTSFWYKKKEHPIRTGVWVSMNLVAQIIGALAMYGLGLVDAAIASWRLLFLVCGAITIIVGAVFILVFPEGPANAKFFTEREREIAIARLAAEKVSEDSNKFEMYQLIETAKDPKAWLILAMSLGECLTSFVITFQSIIINELGFNQFRTLLLGLPAPAIQLVILWISVIGCMIWPNSRTIWGMCITLVPLVGNIVMFTLPVENSYGRLGGTWLANVLTPLMNLTLSLSASNFLGHTKKTVIATTYFIGYCLGLIIGPQFWLTKQAPTYELGLTLDIVFLGLLFITFALFRWLASKENKRRNKMANEGHAEYVVEISSKSEGVTNKTDKEELSFRYTL